MFAPMDPSTNDDAVPRYEVRIDGSPAAPTRTITPKRVVLAVVALVIALRFPYGFGVSVALPVFFAWLGLRIGAKSPGARPYTVRFFEDVLEITGEGYVARTPWEHVDDVKESDTGVVIAMPGGRQIAIPKAALPDDRRVLIDAMPAHVRYEVVPPAAPPKQNRYKTLALWLALLVLFYAIYQAMERG